MHPIRMQGSTAEVLANDRAWSFRPIKGIARVYLGKMLQPEKKNSEDVEKHYLRSANIQWDRVNVSDTKTMWFNPSELQPCRVREGDLLVAEGGEVGRTAIWRGELPEVYIQNSVHKVTCVPLASPRYLFFIFYTLGKCGYFDAIVNKVSIGHLTREKLTAVPVLLPPRSEQDTIVAFLDRKLEQVDRFIAAKQRLIALLQEQKTALINRAVTKGLNPDAPTKNSGIEGLEEVPAHWEVKRAKFFFREIDQRSTTGSEELLSVSHITGVSRRSEKDVTMFMAESYEGSKTCQPNDLVINIMWAWMGALGVAGEVGIVSPAYGVYRQRKANIFNPEYLDLLARTKAYVAEYNRVSTGIHSSRLRMYTDDFFDIPILCPPRAEQDRIIQHIKKEASRLDQAMSQAEREIELIKELRTTLISDAVTGRIALQLPVEKKSERRANSHFCRSVLAAEIVDFHQDTRRFGKVKLQKILILAERHLRLEEIDSEPTRAAAGPFDNKMMRSVHAQIERQKWFRPTMQDGATVYKPMEKAGEHRQYFERYWGSRRQEFNRLIELVKPMSTEQAEIVATLYMAWNDLLIEGHEVTADAVVNEVLNNWDDAKKRISEERWRNAMDWMKAHTLVPTGYGGHTKSGNAAGQIKAKGRRKCD